MSYLSLLIPIALGMGLVGLAAFLWSLRSGQYEDLDGAAARVLPSGADAPLSLQARKNDAAALPTRGNATAANGVCSRIETEGFEDVSSK
ncbi:cbb3-type cytochrome oxidase assembly protein CcoS [Aminobacter anthyllidis]|uniref:cbb3-type cytochrome oxidase assembly protein CcoS n=1 Tax=Aminobacter anthyllidis TaxID=1035067 RepID=UPI002453795A|nr:cbb3-type cytochrome oxidase assembly protein CcoS [Aminobacter anthyllidis]MDH4984973.1 cbb3-type cytochrome oxidase assembly protein CcoS [Aminobacter anthyllidis]